MTALRQPFALSPFELAKQDASELNQSIGRIVERSEDRLAVGDRQCEERRLALDRILEPLGGVIEACVSEHAGERRDVLVCDRDARQVHRHERTRVRVVRKKDATRATRSQGGRAGTRFVPLSPEGARVRPFYRLVGGVA